MSDWVYLLCRLLGITQQLPRLVHTTFYSICARKGKCGGEDMPKVAVALDNIIGKVVLHDGTVDHLPLLIHLSEVGVAKWDTKFWLCLGIEAHWLAIIHHSRVELLLTLEKCSEIGIVDSHAKLAVELSLALESLAEDTVGSNIIAHHLHGIAYAVERGDTVFDCLLVVGIAIDIAIGEGLVVIGCSLIHNTDAAITGAQLVEDVNDVVGVLDRFS